MEHPLPSLMGGGPEGLGMVTQLPTRVMLDMTW